VALFTVVKGFFAVVADKTRLVGTMVTHGYQRFLLRLEDCHMAVFANHAL
jgi:hypothetical protein